MTTADMSTRPTDERTTTPDKGRSRLPGRARRGWPLGRAVFLGVVLVAGLAAQARAEIIDRILAVVGTDLITQTDVSAALQFGLVEVPAGTQDRVRAAIDQLIDRRLQLAEVNRYLPPEPAAVAIDERLTAIRARFESAAAFDAALAEAGLTVELLRGRVREMLRIASYSNQRFAAALQPAEDELLRYYRAHEADFTVQGTLRPFAEVREEARRRVLAERTDALVRAWTEGLRRRTGVTVLYIASGQPGR
jgi:hypothetical protein